MTWLRPLLRLSIFSFTALLMQAASCGPAIPGPDYCTQGASLGVERLELGQELNGEFTPLRDGDSVQLVFGTQGGAMLPVQLRAFGSTVPHCMDQQTIVRDAAQRRIGEVAGPLYTYAQNSGDPARETDLLYIVLDEGPPPEEGASLQLQTRVGEVEATTTIALRR